MDNDNLIRMANRIGDFFASMPCHEEAVEGVATHLRKFWDPRMRKQMREHVEQHGGEGLSPLVLEALKTREI